MWCTRPLTPKIVNAASKNVKLLSRLHCVLMQKLVAGTGFYAGVDYYLGCLSALSDEDYRQERESEREVKYCTVGLLFESSKTADSHLWALV